jgi:hypothetical protein
MWDNCTTQDLWSHEIVIALEKQFPGHAFELVQLLASSEEDDERLGKVQVFVDKRNSMVSYPSRRHISEHAHIDEEDKATAEEWEKLSVVLAEVKEFIERELKDETTALS